MNIEMLEPGAPPSLNVLVLAYYFPPMGLSGVQRTLKFVKYLPEFGWRPIVLTAGETPYYAHDPSLLEETEPLVEGGLVRIVRTKQSGAPSTRLARKEGQTLKLPRERYQRMGSKLLQTIYQPDSRIKWRRPALTEAEAIFHEERIDAIYATAPPFTDFLIARDLSSKHHVPFLMDYRDGWVSNPVHNFYATPFHKAYARKLEDSCLRASSAITVASRRLKEVLLRHYPYLRHEDVVIVHHGYDPVDMVRGEAASAKYRDREKFRMTYGGLFHAGRAGKFRYSPVPLFQAVKLAIKQDSALAGDIELAFAGVLQKEYIKTAEKLGLSANLRPMGYLPHREEVALLFASDVLWMTIPEDYSVPGKLYEYFGTHKPILGLVPSGSQAERHLKDYGAGVIVPPNDIPAIAAAILELYHKWHKSLLPHNVNIPFVQSFDRRQLTREMARQLGLMLRP